MKAAGRFLVVKRTPGISTTDLVGRMLLCTKNHFINSLLHMLSGEEGPGSHEERRRLGEEMSIRIKEYATDRTGLQPGCKVFSWSASKSAVEDYLSAEGGTTKLMVDGQGPQPGQRIVYVDGGFDLFSSGHIEFLRHVVKTEEVISTASDHNNCSSRLSRSAYIIAGLHDDMVINQWKGVNYPIMNIFERGLCVLQCRVSFDQEDVANSLMTADYSPVHRLCHFLCALYAFGGISIQFAFRKTRCGLSWSNFIHAIDVRSVR